MHMTKKIRNSTPENQRIEKTTQQTARNRHEQPDERQDERLGEGTIKDEQGRAETENERGDHRPDEPRGS